MTERMTAAELRALQSVGARPKRRIDREGPIHMACLGYLEAVLPGAVIHHSANELDLGGDPKAKARTQARAKELGMRPGWPDIEVLWRGAFWTFEVKAPGKGPTKAQQECGAAIEAAGGRWAVVRSVDDVQRCLGEWMAAMPGPAVPVPLRGPIR